MEQGRTQDDREIITGQVASFDLAQQNARLLALEAARLDVSPEIATPLQVIKVAKDELLAVSPAVLLVREEHAQRASQLLAGWSGPTRIRCGVGIPIGVVRFTAPSREALTPAVLDMLWDEGIAANFSYVTPSGPYVKGGADTPEHPHGATPKWNARSRRRHGLGVRIAVIDTGINCADTEWARSWLHGIPEDAANRDPLRATGKSTLTSGGGHGTFVAGVIRQIAPAAVVNVYKALDGEGTGDEERVACAILRAAADGADIINLSLGSETYRDRPPVALEAALQAIPDHIVVVAAAGNQGSRRPFWPAAFKRVIAVAALDVDGGPAPWSNRGSWVDLSTRGEGVVSTFVYGEEAPEDDPNPENFEVKAPWAMWSGTSFAAPQVAGLIALASSGRTPREAAADLLRSGTRLPDYGIAIDTPLRYVHV